MLGSSQSSGLSLHCCVPSRLVLSATHRLVISPAYAKLPRKAPLTSHGLRHLAAEALGLPVMSLIFLCAADADAASSKGA